MLWIIIACIDVYIDYFYPYMLWIFIFILDYLHPGITIDQLALRIDSQDSGSRGRAWICVLKLVVKLDHAKHTRHGICLFGMYMISSWLVTSLCCTCLHIHDFLVLQEEFHFELYKETLQELGFSQKDLRLGGFLWVLACLTRSTWMVCWDGKIVRFMWIHQKKCLTHLASRKEGMNPNLIATSFHSLRFIHFIPWGWPVWFSWSQEAAEIHVFFSEAAGGTENGRSLGWGILHRVITTWMSRWKCW